MGTGDRAMRFYPVMDTRLVGSVPTPRSKSFSHITPTRMWPMIKVGTIDPRRH